MKGCFAGLASGCIRLPPTINGSKLGWEQSRIEKTNNTAGRHNKPLLLAQQLVLVDFPSAALSHVRGSFLPLVWNYDLFVPGTS